MLQNIYQVTAKTLPDAWWQCLYGVLRHGRKFLIDRGSYKGQTRLEFDYITVCIERPDLRCADGLPLIPEMPEGSTIPAPVDKDYVIKYTPYIMTDLIGKNELYTYGSRLHGTDGVDQVQYAIETYKSAERTNQMCLSIAQPSDIILEHSPCLRHIDTRLQDGYLHFYPYFRSWDLWGGFPANLAGISMLQEYMASEIGVRQGEMVCSSKGLHLYGYVEDIAKLVAKREE